MVWKVLEASGNFQNDSRLDMFYMLVETNYSFVFPNKKKRRQILDESRGIWHFEIDFKRLWQLYNDSIFTSVIYNDFSVVYEVFSSVWQFLNDSRDVIISPVTRPKRLFPFWLNCRARTGSVLGSGNEIDYCLHHRKYYMVEKSKLRDFLRWVRLYTEKLVRKKSKIFDKVQ